MPCLSHSRAKSGFVSWILYLVMWLFMILIGTAYDYLIARNITFVTNNIRNIMIVLRTKHQPIIEHGDFLKVFMEPDFGLLDKLREKGIISSKENDDVEAKATPYKKNSKLLEHILEKDQCDGLIEALKVSDQMHIVNYLKASGKYPNEYGEEWPLTDKELKILDTNHVSLVDNLTLTGLLDHLFSSKVVNDRQRESIAAMPTRHEKSQKLLKILRRRSLRDYRETIECLRLSHQDHIAKMLEDGGAVVKVHVNLDGENVTEYENEIVTKIANLLNDRSIDQSSRILELLHHKVIAAKIGQSIVLYFYCKTIEELEHLHESLDSGKLKESVELWFTSLLNRSHKITATAINFSDEELRKMRAYFNGTEHQPTELCDLPLEMLDVILQKSYLHWIFNSPTKQRDEDVIRSLTSVDVCFYQRITRKRFKMSIWRYISKLYDLPFEILDIILQKSYLHWILNSTIKTRDEQVIRSLISVDVCFNQRITRKRFKKTIWRHLKDLYEKNKKRTAIIRNNQKFLLETIQPNDKLIASLLSLDCITEEQRHLIQRQLLKQKQRRKQDKNAELSHFLRSFDESKFANLVKCLRQTDQKIVARIMESGGVVIKVAVGLQNRIKELQTKFKDLLDRTKPWSPLTDKQMSQLNVEGVAIVNSQLERQTVVVWISCRSQAAIKYIQEMYESNELKAIFELNAIFLRLANIHPSSEMMRLISLNIDGTQFKKTIAERQISINFTERVGKGDEDVYGVSKLRNKLYVLCHSDSHTRVINVFEDRNPFFLQKAIELSEMKFPIDIGSSEKENCLYVADYAVKCVWKITKETSDKHKIINWVTTDQAPDTLSVSSDGQLLVVNMYRSILSIYESDASFLRSVLLPEFIKNPRHAVETSIGNFIIIHQCMEVKEVKSGSSGEENQINWVLSQLTGDGKIVRRFASSNETQQLVDPMHLSLDSDDQVFVVDKGIHGVVLLDSDLKWNRILCPRSEAKETSVEWPRRLFYDEEMKQLIVGGDKGANVYTLSLN